MNISIKNFKSIVKLDEFDLKPLTILSGNNSTGKSSFIQLLLILKQTLEIASSKKQLFIHGDYYSAKRQIDLITGKRKSKTLEIGFSIDKNEFDEYGEKVTKSLYDSFTNYTCNLSLLFHFSKSPISELEINQFYLQYITEIKPEFLKLKIDSRNKIYIESNNESYFLSSEFATDNDSLETTRRIKSVNYSSFFPISCEETVQLKLRNPKGKISYSGYEATTRININSVKSFLEKFFDDLYYIGPLRIEPQDSYAGNSEKNWVGTKGEFTAQVLETRQNEIIECNVPVFTNGILKFRSRKITLIEATNIWICKVFKFGKSIFAKEIGDTYSIYLLNGSGITTTVKHVGFGISQILPVVVQGLLMQKGDTLILEQPEIHLHPKIQSALFDFLYSLVIQGKKLIVETHSDHFLLRLRRRVAEDTSNILLDKINLTFIERKKSGVRFKNIQLDDLGVYEMFPEDFIENPERELMALLDAQMRKRKLKKTVNEIRGNN